MATFLFGGPNGVTKGGWPDELPRVRPEIEGTGGLVNLSMGASGPLSALAQVALALNAQPGDMIIWDHADSLISCFKDDGYDPEEILRAVEMFLRGCARRKILVAPLISERCEEARSVEIDEIQARLAHLFERFSTPTLSMTAELRASLVARELQPANFSENGEIYLPDRPVSMHLARAVAEHVKQIERAKRAPKQRADGVYAGSKGVIRVAPSANAGARNAATEKRVKLGPIAASVLEIAPGGSVEYDVEGELLGAAVVLGPDEGLLRISIDSEGYDDLRRTPISLWRPFGEAAFGQVSVTHLLGRRAALSFPTRVILHNASDNPGEAPIRADHGAAPPTELNPKAAIRVLALIERRPHQHGPPDAAPKRGERKAEKKPDGKKSARPENARPENARPENARLAQTEAGDSTPKAIEAAIRESEEARLRR